MLSTTLYISGDKSRGPLLDPLLLSKIKLVIQALDDNEVRLHIFCKYFKALDHMNQKLLLTKHNFHGIWGETASQTDS